MSYHAVFSLLTDQYKVDLQLLLGTASRFLFVFLNTAHLERDIANKLWLHCGLSYVSCWYTKIKLVLSATLKYTVVELVLYT